MRRYLGAAAAKTETHTIKAGNQAITSSEMAPQSSCRPTLE
jgi:hypothetical protein